MLSIVPSVFTDAQPPLKPVLVQSAISDRAPVFGFETMTVEVYADVVKIKKTPLGNTRKIGVPNRKTSTRGHVKNFSRKSRKRMIEQLAKLRNPNNGFFFTMTYPDDVPHTPEKAKRDLAALRKRLLRRFPAAGGLWRIEIKPRLSGDHVGQLAPHFHVLVFGMPYRQNLMRLWLQAAWSRIVYETSAPPRSVRTRADVIHSRKHAARYAAKYAAKEEPLENCNNGEDFVTWGRRWGYFGALDFAVAVTVTRSASQIIELRRMVARWMRSRGSDYAQRVARANPHFGFSALGLGDLSAGHSNISASTIVRMLDAI